MKFNHIFTANSLEICFKLSNSELPANHYSVSCRNYSILSAHGTLDEKPNTINYFIQFDNSFACYCDQMKPLELWGRIQHLVIVI